MRKLLIIPHLHPEPTSIGYVVTTIGGWDGSPPKLLPLYLNVYICFVLEKYFFFAKWHHICFQNSFVCFIHLTIGLGNLSKSVHRGTD